MKIAIIGAGPSGMAAALRAAGAGCPVILFEQNAAPGRKLLVTGSGRCNIGNDALAASKYVCGDPAWMETLLARFGPPDLEALLLETGVLLTKTPDGWYYPLSNSAQTVVDALTSALERAGVDIRLAIRVTGITPTKKGFLLKFYTKDGPTEEACERLIVAGGGKAYPTLGSRGELFPILEHLGHSVIPKRPALAPILADLGELQEIQGVRLDVGARLLAGNVCLAQAAGNLIFTEWGLNGPAVMDLSHAVPPKPSANLSLALDLLFFFESEFFAHLKKNRSTGLPLKVFLGAFFPPKVARLYQRLAHLPGDLPLGEVEEASLQNLVGCLRDTRLAVKGVRGFEYAQVSAGGVPVAEVNPVTLESRLLPGLYLVGETVDVVGPCGGYNLHYAFASGALAGAAAAKR